MLPRSVAFWLEMTGSFPRVCNASPDYRRTDTNLSGDVLVVVRISVIIPSLNMARFLPDAITSIQRQDRAVHEILVIDPSSTDKTAEVVAALAASGAPIRRIETERCGPARARNLGLEQAQGDVIAFLDADDLWPSTKLSRQCARLDDRPRMDMVSGLVCFFDKLDPTLLTPAADASTSTMVHIHLGACLYRRSVFEQVGGFDERLHFCEDLDLVQRLREQAIPFTILRDITLYYRRHGDSMLAQSDPRQLVNYRHALALSRARQRALGQNRKLPSFESFLESACEVMSYSTV
jgi:glycosyltransferase involved in cell wall biosynthesis